MVSSADNTAGGFLSAKKNSLAAGQDAIGIKVLTIKNQSSTNMKMKCFFI